VGLVHGGGGEAPEGEVDTPDIEISPDRKYIHITIRIEEGEQFSIGELGFSGDPLDSEEGFEGLLEKLSIEQGEVFNRSKLGQDLLKLKTRYEDDGSIDAHDKQAFSLRTGHTQAMRAMDKAPAGPGASRVSEDDLISEMKGGRGKVIALALAQEGARVAATPKKPGAGDLLTAARKMPLPIIHYWAAPAPSETSSNPHSI